MSAVDSESLRKHPTLTFSLGPYNYELESNASKSTLFVRKEKDVRSHDLLWAFGFSHMGQTYLYEQNGDFYEAHLSFYSALQGLDITPGHERTIPKGFDDALDFRADMIAGKLTAVERLDEIELGALVIFEEFGQGLDGDLVFLLVRHDILRLGGAGEWGR